MWLGRATEASQNEKDLGATSTVESASNDSGSSEEETERNRVLLQENNKRILAMYDRDQR